MEEIEFLLFLSSYFYTYMLCQSIFALSDTVLNSLTLSAHLIHQPTLPSCFLFTVNIDEKSNLFVWNCLKKIPSSHWTSLWYTFFCECVHMCYMGVRVIHTCAYSTCLMHTPTSLKSAALPLHSLVS